MVGVQAPFFMEVSVAVWLTYILGREDWWLTTRGDRKFESIGAVLTEGSSQAGVSDRSRQDFSEALYDSCVRADGGGRQTFCSAHSTWFSVLQAAFRFTDRKRVNREQWVGGLAVAMGKNHIEWVPGSHGSRLTHRRAVKLVGYQPSLEGLAARPGSLKRAAIEAEERATKRLRRQVIDFRNKIPFKRTPRLVREGFQGQEKNFRRGDQRVLEHYHVASTCVEQCLGDPVCDVMLMLVLTFASSSVTPCVRVGKKGFSAGPRKEAGLLAANLVTRMLWFYRPERFPVKEDGGRVLGISEMTKKIGEYVGFDGAMDRSYLSPPQAESAEEGEG